MYSDTHTYLYTYVHTCVYTYTYIYIHICIEKLDSAREIWKQGRPRTTAEIPGLPTGSPHTYIYICICIYLQIRCEYTT